MDASVKALKVARNPEDGAEAVYVEATPENVASGDYAIARPFNIAYKADNLSATAQDFINWILSAEGQAIVTAQKYVAKEPAEYQAAPVAGKIVIGGSSSVGPLMQKLEEAYEALHPEVDIEVQISDSSTGMRGAADGSFDIGMASREVKASELEAGLTPVTICMDGIAVIVNADSKVEDLTVEQIAQVFTGEIADWSELGGDAGAIACIGREGGSGTRDGFESITGTEGACVLSQELTSTGAVIEAVKNNPQAIGYASLSAVEGKEGIKAITVGGVPCTEETVLDGSYQIQRPFVMVTRESEALNPAAQAFFDWAVSADAADLIRQAGAVPLA